MRRREFLCVLGGAAATWPSRVRAQQPERRRRIGILHDYTENDPDGRAQITAFREELAKLGWNESSNVAFDFHSGAAEADDLRPLARDLMAKGPDVVLGAGGTIVAAL